MSSLKRSVVALEMDVASVKEKQKLSERTIMEVEKKLRIHEPGGGGYSTDARCLGRAVRPGRSNPDPV